MNEIKKGSGKEGLDTIDERIEQVKNIFKMVGMVNFDRALSMHKVSAPVAPGERIVAELDEDEALFMDLMEYVALSHGDNGRISPLMMPGLKTAFWTCVRSRYGYSMTGDLGVREDSEGRKVLVLRPTQEKGREAVEKLDIGMLLQMAGLGTGTIGRS